MRWREMDLEMQRWMEGVKEQMKDGMEDEKMKVGNSVSIMCNKGIEEFMQER